MCEADGGRFETDETCTSAADVAAAAKVAATAAANTKREAIEDYTVAAKTNPQEYTIKRKGGAITAIDDPALYEDEGDAAFVLMDGKYVRDNGGGNVEIIGVHTIGLSAPKEQSFRSVYGDNMKDGDENFADAPEVLAITASPSEQPEDAGGTNARMYTPLATADVGKRVAGTGFPSTSGATKDFAEDDTSDGTFDGASGNFKCTATCTAAAGADGALTLTGDWDFTPDDSQKVNGLRMEISLSMGSGSVKRIRTARPPTTRSRLSRMPSGMPVAMMDLRQIQPWQERPLLQAALPAYTSMTLWTPTLNRKALLPAHSRPMFL